MIHSTTIYQWIKVEQEDIVVPDVLMKKGTEKDWYAESI
ncbi:hypothetical protein SJDPG12_03595 [Porphyromonas gingivalis SJD12]|nr:hypothetical protein SJDPG12_03595 [Porphyromonas gingivalis SJD12]